MEKERRPNCSTCGAPRKPRRAIAGSVDSGLCASCARRSSMTKKPPPPQLAIVPPVRIAGEGCTSGPGVCLVLDCKRNLIGGLRESGAYAVKGLTVPLRRTNGHTLDVRELDDLTTQAADLVVERIEELMEKVGSCCANDLKGGMSLGEIGVVLEVTGERARQHESMGLRKLRRRVEVQRLEEDVGEAVDVRVMASGCRRV